MNNTINAYTAAINNLTDELGYGLRESVYQQALAVELRFQGYNVDLEVNKSILYHGHHVGTVHHHRHHDPWAHCPLVSNASSTRCFHVSLSLAMPATS